MWNREKTKTVNKRNKERNTKQTKPQKKNNAVNRREASRESMEPKRSIHTPERDRAALEEVTN